MKTLKIRTILVIVAGISSALLINQPARALATIVGNAENGQASLEQNCSSCHIGRFGGDGSKIYTREDHRVKTIEGLMQQVQYCNANALGGSLSAEQEDDITAYLNETFYKYDD